MDASQDPMTVAAMWQLIVQRRAWLLACLALTVGGGGAYLLVAEPVHLVRARLLVESQSLAANGGRTDRDKDFLATQAEIIRSPAVVERAVERLGLPEAAPGEPSPIVDILEALSVNPLLGTNVLSVTLQGPRADEATRTVEAVIESYREYLRESERGDHLDTLKALTASEKQVREDLQALEAEYRKLREESPLVGRGDDADIQRELLAHLGQTLADARGQRMQLENRVSALEGMQRRNLVATESPRIIQASVAQGETLPVPSAEPAEHSLLSRYSEEAVTDIVHIREQLLAAQAREKELSEKYGDKHAAIRGVREQIANWEAQLKERTAAAPLLLQQELDAARAQEQQLVALYEDEFAKAKQVDHWLLEEQQAMALIQRTREVHESILSQVRQWQLVDQSLAQGKSGVAVQVLEQPALAEHQVWPPKALVLGACGLIGLVGGLGLVLAVGPPAAPAPAASRTASAFRLPVLERIPSSGPAGESELANGPSSLPPVVLEQPDSAAAAAFDRLARYLENAAAGASGATVQLSAVAARQRATLTTVNVAVSLARRHHKVAIVDADLRRGSVGEMLHVFGSAGLSTVLAGQVALEDALQRSPLAAVDVISRGAGSDVEAGAVATRRFEELLESLRAQYDFVLVDAPAIRLIGGERFVPAASIDGLLLVSTAEASASAVVQHAAEHLRQQGVVVLGAVLYQAAEAGTPAPAAAALV